MTSHLRSASHQIRHTVDVKFSSLALAQAPWEPHTGMPSFRPTPEQQIHIHIHIRVLFHFQWRIPALL